MLVLLTIRFIMVRLILRFRMAAAGHDEANMILSSGIKVPPPPKTASDG